MSTNEYVLIHLYLFKQGSSVCSDVFHPSRASIVSLSLRASWRSAGLPPVKRHIDTLLLWLASSWPHLRYDVGLEEGEYK